jgi:N-acetylmuramoyl-L-alanine amidase
MSRHLRRAAGAALWCCLPALGLIVAAPGQAAPVVLRSIRHSSDAARTRVVLDLSASATYRHFALGNPSRIVVEVSAAQAARGLSSQAVGDGHVSRVRVNAYSIFTLKSPFRVVLDVKHGGAKAPAPAPAASAPAPEGTRDAPAREAPAGDVPAPSVPERTPRTGPYVVAIDAGHGGEDPGARYHGTSEKDITLDLARALAAELESRPGVKPVLVRKGDYFIPLRKRWDLAERMEADIFISLHCNANPDPTARGTEVFFLSLKGASDAAAREVAARENEVDEKMGVVPEDPVTAIVNDMIQTDVLLKSEHLAEECLRALLSLGTVYERGVKQAGFEVLKSPRMPSVLVEAAFISNKAENKLLRDGKWQEKLSERLAEGIDAYLRQVARAE